jgi:hypothetical protein
MLHEFILHATILPGFGIRPNRSQSQPDTIPCVFMTGEPKAQTERDLGVIEAITVVTRSCPSGVVVGAAERALEAIKTGGPGVLRDQAYFVLMAIQGWRGDRATQVHRSLTHYLEQGKPLEQTHPLEKAEPPEPT